MSPTVLGKAMEPEEYFVSNKRHTSHNRNPNKPEKWNFKLFALNDATTSYQCDFIYMKNIKDNMYSIIYVLQGNIQS